MVLSTLSVVIITASTSTVVSIAVKYIWDWISNKNGKLDLERLKTEIYEKINEKTSIFEEIRKELSTQAQQFAELKNLILGEYARKKEVEKLSDCYMSLRDMAVTNSTYIKTINEKIYTLDEKINEKE
jgi:DNA gyrase/topoisomerase IV subunit A